MPKELTHWILAERALAALDPACGIGELIRGSRDLYLAGAVLPDTLLHHVRGPYSATALALARQFHDPAGNSFAPLIAAEQGYPDGLPPPLQACLLGVVAHMQADIVFHPFVYALTGTDEIGRHYQLETDLDVHFLQSGARPAVRLLSDLVSPDSRPTLVDASALVFDPRGQLPRQALEQALDHHCRFQGMYDRPFWKLAVRLAARLAGSPFTRQRHLFYPLSGSHPAGLDGSDAVEWRHPVSGELQRTSVTQLADETVDRIRKTFERVETAGSLAGALASSPGENLLTGMHGARFCDMTVEAADR